MSKRQPSNGRKARPLSERLVQATAPARSAMQPRRSYTPVDARDVTGELAAFTGRGTNGRVTPTRHVNGNGTSTTDVMRAKLPRATDVFKTLREGGSDALANAVREQEAEERAVEEEKLRRSQAEYDSYLSRRERPTVEELQEILDEPDTQVEVASDGSVRPYDENFRRLEADARRAAEQIKATSPASVIAPQIMMPAPSLQTTAMPPVTSVVSDVVSRLVTTVDVDHLWDWLRADASKPDDHAWMFLGRSFPTSPALHEHIRALANNPNAAIRSLDVKQGHIGFYVLNPIDKVNNTAMLHVYLAPAIRMNILTLAPYILTGARQIIGPRMNLATYSPREHERFERFFSQFGFKMYVTFVQHGEGQTPIVSNR